MHIKNLFVCFPHRLPWDSSTLIGFIGEICFVLISYHFYNIINGSAILLFISICLHHRAFYKMIQHSIGKLDCSVNHQNHQNRDQLFCELIHFHISAQKLEEILTNVCTNAMNLIDFTLVSVFSWIRLKFTALIQQST